MSGAPHIDLLDRDRFVDGVPHDWFDWLREHDPVHFHREPEGPGFWVVTRHADVSALSRDTEAFSSEQRAGGVLALDERDLPPPSSARSRRAG